MAQKIADQFFDTFITKVFSKNFHIEESKSDFQTTNTQRRPVGLKVKIEYNWALAILANK